MLELGDQPFLLIDCGRDTLDSYLSRYPRLPEAIFVTHAHFDHIGGLEGLFYRLATTGRTEHLVTLFVPVPLVPVLQRRLADYPNLLAEGGSNFWDVFQLIPVNEAMWYRDMRFTIFPVRHHEYQSAFGIALQGAFLYSGDTRPIPEVINRFASHGEQILHVAARRRVRPMPASRKCLSSTSASRENAWCSTITNPSRPASR